MDLDEAYTDERLAGDAHRTRRPQSPSCSDMAATAKRQKRTDSDAEEVGTYGESSNDIVIANDSDDDEDDDDQFEEVADIADSHPQIAYDSDDSLPELGTVELTIGDAAAASVFATRTKKKRRAAVTKRARMVRRCHHMADLVCQVAAARMLNQICRADEIVARCLSLVSPFAVARIAEHLVPGRLVIRREWASSDLHYFLSSYQGLKIKTRRNRRATAEQSGTAIGGDGNGRSVLQEFALFLESRVATQPWHRPMLLTSMLRGLLFDARLCVGLAPAPLKITVQESADVEKQLAAVDIQLVPGTLSAYDSDNDNGNSNDSSAGQSSPGKKSPTRTRSDDSGVPQYWCEVFDQVSERWMVVNAHTGAVERATQIANPGKGAGCVYPYVVALDGAGYMRDITRRYTRDFVNTTMRQRLESVSAATDAHARVWWAQWIAQWENPDACDRDEKEDAEMERSALRSTMPKRISDFASNPYYVLARNLSQNEVIHPPEPVVGTVRGESVYLRENVKTLRSRMVWMREGREVRPGATPIKTVKQRAVTARAKLAADAEVAAGRPPPMAELFGEWQTQPFRPPPVVDGHVPRNEYGRVDLFCASMLPEGAAHVRDAEAKAVCRDLDIDAADAVVGFEFRRGTSTPILAGVVIPMGALAVVMDAVAERRSAAQDKLLRAVELRAIKRWRRLLVALRVREEVDASFATRSARDDGAVVSFPKP
ncbi:hypothetical protein H4217_001721 [Coemansia sp. RSA 1939]|nr:hypothetical protein H4217_001721 [Coemansia sp. RSA 1939]KAJ2610038.1 hypothetical protein EV177_004162 [Coemansia sp. RSA 1804]